jgi:hypothetical protein
MPKSTDDPKKVPTQAPVKQLGPRPGAASWSAPARKVKLATRDPRSTRR